MPSSLVNLLVAFLVLLSLIFLSVTGILNPILDGGRKLVEVLAFPFFKIFEWLKQLTRTFFFATELAYQNRLLNEQSAQLSAEVAELENFRSENQRLREALGFVSSSQLALLPAEVISRDPLFQQQSAIVNRGRRHGVTEGAAVVVAGRVLVGVVRSVFDNSSLLEFVTSSAVTVNAQSASGEASGVVKGEHGLGLFLDLVSQTEVVNVGDKIVTSGLGGQFPKNLLLGEVADVRSAPSELFQQATVIPAVDLRKLDVVFIVK